MEWAIGTIPQSPRFHQPPAAHYIFTVAPNVGLDREQPQSSIKYDNEANNGIGRVFSYGVTPDTEPDSEHPQGSVNRHSEGNGTFSYFSWLLIVKPSGSEPAQPGGSLPNTTVGDMEVDPELCQPLEARPPVDDCVSQFPVMSSEVQNS